MGTPIEYRVKARSKRKRIQDIVLRSLYATAAVGLAMAAPNSVQLLRHVHKYIDDAPNLDRRLAQAFTRLIEKGLVIRSKGNRFELTKKGEQLAASLESVNVQQPIPLRWDGKWRMVIFDIWERRRNARDRLRFILGKNGFVKMQNSVWVYPYDCEELFAFLRANLSLGSSIIYIVAEEIENDRKLRLHFGLRMRG